MFVVVQMVVVMNVIRVPLLLSQPFLKNNRIHWVIIEYYSRMCTQMPQLLSEFILALLYGLVGLPLLCQLRTS